MTTQTPKFFRLGMLWTVAIVLGCAAPESDTSNAPVVADETDGAPANYSDTPGPNATSNSSVQGSGTNAAISTMDLPEEYLGPTNVVVGEMRTNHLANGDRSIDVNVACDDCTGPLYIICVLDPIDSPSAEDCVANITVDAPYEVKFENLPDEGSVYFRARWEETNDAGKPFRAWTTSWTEAADDFAGPVKLSLDQT